MSSSARPEMKLHAEAKTSRTHSHFFAIDPRARDARFVIPWKTTCKDATARDDRPRLVTLTSVERHFFRLSHNTAISTVLHERLESHQTNQICLQACIHVASTFLYTHTRLFALERPRPITLWIPALDMCTAIRSYQSDALHRQANVIQTL